MTSSYGEIVERLEKLDGAHRDVDFAIGHAIGLQPRWPDLMPRFTSSLDDAFTILPPMTNMDRPVAIEIRTTESGTFHFAQLTNFVLGTVKTTRFRSRVLAICALGLLVRDATGFRALTVNENG